MLQSYKPEADWLEKQKDILDEFVRLEGRGDYGGFGICGWGGCTSTELLYRCRDCFDPQMHCRECMVLKHEMNPLHRIQVCYL
jgi:hypothetical protein